MTTTLNGPAKKKATELSGCATDMDLSRDRARTFGPQIVKERERRLSDVDEVVSSPYAKAPMTGEIRARMP